VGEPRARQPAKLDRALPLKRSRLHFPKPLPRAEQNALCARAQTGDVKATQLLVRSNIGFLQKQAGRFARQTTLLDVDDLVSEGVLGMMRALQDFDPNRGKSFLTYAKWWIDHYMRRAVLQTVIRITAPVDILSRVWANRFERERQALQDSGLSATQIDATVARGQDMTLDRLRASEALRRPPTSLEQPLSDGTDHSLHDVLASGDQTSEERVADVEWLARLQGAVARLACRLPFTRRVVLRERIVNQLPLHRVGEMLDISRERVRQIEWELRSQLREALRRDYPDELASESDPIQKRRARNLANVVR
jgi:RNA polymerase sigma factor (sigma-70 family)